MTAKQISLKLNDEEHKQLEELKELLNLKRTFGEDSQALKKGVILAIEYLNKVIPSFILYENLFVDDRKKVYTNVLKNQEISVLQDMIKDKEKSNTQ